MQKIRMGYTHFLRSGAGMHKVKPKKAAKNACRKSKSQRWQKSL